MATNQQLKQNGDRIERLNRRNRAAERAAIMRIRSDARFKAQRELEESAKHFALMQPPSQIVINNPLDICFIAWYGNHYEDMPAFAAIDLYLARPDIDLDDRKTALVLSAWLGMGFRDIDVTDKDVEAVLDSIPVSVYVRARAIAKRKEEDALASLLEAGF